MDDESNAGVEKEEGAVLDDETDTGVKEDESVSSADSEDGTDWKAEFDKEHERAENYKKAFDQKRQFRKKEAPTSDVEAEEDEARPATVADIRKIVTETNTTSSVDSRLKNLVKDENKRKLVKLYYDTRIRQTGTSDESIQADLQTALDLADAPRLRKTISEVARVNDQEKVPNMQGGGSDRGADKGNHKFSADQVKSLTARATQLGIDPKKYVEQAWKNQAGR